MKTYDLGVTLQETSAIQDSAEPTHLQVALLSLKEFQHQFSTTPSLHAFASDLARIEYCRAHFAGNSILGTICMPIKAEHIQEKIRFGFYLNAQQLFLIGNESELVSLFDPIEDLSFPENMTIPAFFCRLLNSWLDDDVIFLQKTEEKLSSIEEELLDSFSSNFYETLVPYRKNVEALHSYYSQVVGMGIAIRVNTNEMLTDEECLAYSYFADRAERLHHHAEVLRDYVFHLRDMYQGQIQLRQSKSMNLLTVISAIFLPLTLLVGWYGMNFSNMPELSWSFGYPGVLLLSVLIIIVEIVFFRKKDLF